ncbi:MAG: hypothetical protein V1841_01765 [Patescibacteria group bacterium]
MISQDVFFLIASIFLGILTILLVIVFIYWMRILKNFYRISNDLRELEKTFKEKLEKFSGILAGIGVFIEKIADYYLSRKEKKEQKSRKRE